MKNWKVSLAGGVATACLLVACVGGGGSVKTKPAASSADTTKTPTKVSGSNKGEAAAHNRIRSKHNLSPLTYSASLAAHAQEWADQLAATKNCQMDHRPKAGPFKRVHGENLYWASAKVWTDGRREVWDVNINNAVDEWAKEEKDYNYASNTCRSGKQCGHYTQIVWKDTKEVGCASKQCSDKTQVWVCNYSPGGNVIGQKPY